MTEPASQVAVAAAVCDQMELEIRKLEGNEMRFVLSDVDPAFANALRRAMLREVPVMAVDEVDFVANDSIMYDEIITHRLAMIPLRTPEGYTLREECGCREGRCSKCSVSLSLKREGPATVLSGDLRSSDEEVGPVSGSIPIVKLAEGQKLEFTAIARLGFGKVHAKWQPGVVAYKYMPVFELDERACDGCGVCVERCPPGLLELEGGKAKIKELERCTMCKSCVEACLRRAIRVAGDPTKFIFTVESTGALHPERIFSEALEALEVKCKEFVKKL